MTPDPGLALRSTTLPAAFALLLAKTSLAPGARDSITAPVHAGEPEEAVEELATGAGLRSRRVLLDARWWTQAATPMIARVVDRRQKARDEEAGEDALGRGWVVLVPRSGG